MYFFKKCFLIVPCLLFCCCVNAQQDCNDIVKDLVADEVSIDSLISGWSEEDKLLIIDELITELKNSDDRLNCDWSRVVNDSIKEYLEAGAYDFTLIADVPPKKIVLMYLIEKVFRTDFNTNYLEMYSVTYSQDSCKVEHAKFYICNSGLAKEDYGNCQKRLESIGCKPDKFLFHRLEKAYVEWFEECKEKGLKVMAIEGKTPLSSTNYRWRDKFIEEKIEEMRDLSMRELIEEAKRRCESNDKN